MASVEFALGGYMRARLETWESDVNTSSNTSVVHARVKVWRTNSWSGQTYSSSVRRRIWIDGSSVCDWTGEISHYNSYGEIEVASGSKTVTHNDDGSKTVGVSAELNDNLTSYFSGSGSLNMGLTTIARKVGISSVTGTYTDENFSPTVKWTNNGNRVDIKLELPTLGDYDWRRWNNKQGSSSFSPQLSQADIQELYSLMPNTTTLTMRFTVVTVINGADAFYDWLDRTFTIVNGKPVFSNYTFADTNSATTAITGNNQIMISGKSTLAVTISAANKATAKKSATMSKYTFQVAGLTADETYTTSSITKTIGSPTVENNETPSATRDLVVTAIDSRSLTTAVTKTLTIVPYSSPTIAATATRANGFGNTTTVKISGTFSRIEVGGTAKNTVNSSTGVKYRYRRQGSSTWGNWTNKTATVNTTTGTVSVADFTLNLDNQAAFEFEFKITDKLETKTASLTVSIGQPAFYIGTDGRVGVGGMPTQSKKTGEAGLLQVVGRAFANGNQLLEDKAGVIKKTNMASKSVGISAIDHAEQATLVYMGLAGFNRRIYSNGYLVLENLKTFIKGAGVNVAISSNTQNLNITLPTTGTYVAEVYGQLWTNDNPQDYLLFQARKNMENFARAMAPKPNGSWAFVELTHPIEIANGDTLQWYLGTNGSNFSDGNIQIADSYTYLKIYKVAD